MFEVPVLLVLIVVVALIFDFTNGAHDCANAIATVVSTKVLSPRVAVVMAASLNFIGAFLGTKVATTLGAGIVNTDMVANCQPLVLAALLGAIAWNLITWYFGIPSSSSHALIGGLMGAAVAYAGFSTLNGASIAEKILLPLILSPLAGFGMGFLTMFLIMLLCARANRNKLTRAFTKLQIVSAAFMATSHGLNDAQKTMGVIFLALVASGTLSNDDAIPLWVKASCAIAIALGTYLGGWRIIRTLGKGIVEVDTPQGVAADGASAAIILTSSHFGMALSTTHVASGSILGSGLGRKGAEVRWSVAGRMVVAWLITLPAAAIVGALTWLIGHGLNALTGTQFVGEMTVFALLVIFCFLMWRHSQKDNIDASNVTGDWDEKEGAAVTSAEVSAEAQTLATGKAGS